MGQVIYGLFRERVRHLSLPAPHTHVRPGLPWGDAAAPFTPAFWAAQVWLADLGKSPRYRVGDSLIEEVAVCLLGGFGFRSEVGLAAFRALRTEGLLAPGTAPGTIERALRAPIQVGGRRVRYRFPAQKARYLGGFLRRIDGEPPPAESTDGLALRDWLLSFDGIGLKTASWVARNWLGSDDVAIVDIHIYRAGLLAGFFEPGLTVVRDYRHLEECFVEFAHAIHVRPSELDAVMWDQMRAFQDIPIKLLRSRGIPAAGTKVRGTGRYTAEGARR
jgi:N-glycosylase/DNA lyase